MTLHTIIETHSNILLIEINSLNLHPSLKGERNEIKLKTK